MSAVKRTSRTSSRPPSTASGGSICSVSNAGIAIDGGIETPTDKWQKIFDVNVMSEVFAAKHVIPHMLEQGGGYLLNTASAAGLLLIPDTVSYTVTKHAAVGFTEWLAATYGDQGITVSLLCPAGVRTPILEGKEGSPQERDVITTDQLVDIVMEALAEERFMISTHRFVLDKFAIKAPRLRRVHQDDACRPCGGGRSGTGLTERRWFSKRSPCAGKGRFSSRTSPPRR